jgi:hypothetical protein
MWNRWFTGLCATGRVELLFWQGQNKFCACHENFVTGTKFIKRERERRRGSRALVREGARIFRVLTNQAGAKVSFEVRRNVG